MRIVLISFAAAVIFSSGSAFAGDTYVHGYTRNDGTYVQPHYRSAPDSTQLNNWSTRGNVNPYTGQSGTVDPYANRGTGSTGYGLNYIGPRR